MRAVMHVRALNVIKTLWGAQVARGTIWIPVEGFTIKTDLEENASETNDRKGIIGYGASDGLEAMTPPKQVCCTTKTLKHTRLPLWKATVFLALVPPVRLYICTWQTQIICLSEAETQYQWCGRITETHLGELDRDEEMRNRAAGHRDEGDV